MKKNFCSREQDILNALRKGTLDLEQKKHLQECSACRDSLTVESWMSGFSKTSYPDIDLKYKIPEFEIIWKGSKTFKKFDKEVERKVLAPLIFPKILIVVIALLGVVLLFTAGTAKAKSFVVEELKMGYLIDLLGVMGKSLIALMPLLVIPIGVVVSLIAFYFIFSLFKPRKVPDS
jgi:hypothetical protein